MATLEVRNQAQLDQALKSAGPFDIIACLGDGHFVVSGSSRVEAWDSSRVEARDSSRVEAWDSSRVEAWDSSRVEARDSSRVEAWDAAQVQARDAAHIKAAKHVAVTVDRRLYGSPKVDGGVVIEVPPVTTAEEWMAVYDLTPVDGLVTLYKAVDDDYSTMNARPKDIYYRPGRAPSAPDWSPTPECGSGLHFSPSPGHAKGFNASATRYVACPVRVDEIVVHSPCEHPTKIKAPRVAGSIVEVDYDGTPLTETVPPRETDP